MKFLWIRMGGQKDRKSKNKHWERFARHFTNKR